MTPEQAKGIIKSQIKAVIYSCKKYDVNFGEAVKESVKELSEKN